mgnify:CR=1 FL=1
MMVLATKGLSCREGTKGRGAGTLGCLRRLVVAPLEHAMMLGCCT